MYLKRSYLGLILWTNAQVSVEGKICIDDPTFLLAEGYDCKFVGKRIKSKGDEICNLQINSVGTTVADKCPNTCNNCASMSHKSMMVPDETPAPTLLPTSYVTAVIPPVNITVSPSAVDITIPEAPIGGYPYECVDHGDDLPRLPKIYPDGSNAFIHACEWVAENPDKRCDQMCPCVEPIALKYHCRKTCSNCPGVPSATPSATPSAMLSATPSAVPSEVIEPLSDCEDQGDGTKVYVDEKLMGLCEWAAISPDDRCEEACPCGEDVGLQIYEVCPQTCGTCSTSVPSAAPSIAPTRAPSTSPTVCEDDDCIVAGDSHTLVPLCDYAAADISGRCDLSYGGKGFIKDYCRYTCYVCRSIVPLCEDTGSDKQVFVPASGGTISICAWAGVFPSKRCLEKCPCKEGEGCYGKLVSEMCEQTCDNCLAPDVPSSKPTSLTSVPSAAPSSKPSSLTSGPSAVPSSTPSSLTLAPSLVSSSKPTICDDNEDCYAVTDGDEIRKLCDWANKKRCKYSNAMYVTPESLPKNAGPLVRDICKKKCKVC
mmetsp:Transcript_38009/g.74433  ORF Transcript_38009/g.74433 Transcript_38009/m.74433 type:complete len:540 (+) Transcript_38009:63-1682(+)